MDKVRGEILERLGVTSPSAPYEDTLKEILTYKTAYRMATDRFILGTAGVPDFIKEWDQRAEYLITEVLAGNIDIQTENRPQSLEPQTSAHTQARGVEVDFSDNDSTDDEPNYVDTGYRNICKFTEVVIDVQNINTASKTKYTRGTDYNIFYETGEIQRIKTGSITESQTVYLYFDYIVKPSFYKDKRSVSYGKSGYNDYV